jgi:hypothetical protein
VRGVGRLATIALLGQLVACGGRTWCDVAHLLDAEVAPTTPGVTDCGTAPLDDDDAVTACLVAAFRAGGPFRGITQQSAAGGELVVRAWAGDDTGVRVLFGSFDLCNDTGCSGQVIRRTCGEPVVGTVGDREQIVCGDTSACGEIVCGFDDGRPCP